MNTNFVMIDVPRKLMHPMAFLFEFSTASAHAIASKHLEKRTTTKKMKRILTVFNKKSMYNFINVAVASTQLSQIIQNPG